jgi:hypothetical protein
MRTWRSQAANLTAALSLAATAVVVGLVAKGMVESIFEKYRLAVALGVALGLTLSGARATRSAAISAMVRPPSPQAGSERPALESRSEEIRLEASRG